MNKIKMTLLGLALLGSNSLFAMEGPAADNFDDLLEVPEVRPELTKNAQTAIVTARLAQAVAESNADKDILKTAMLKIAKETGSEGNTLVRVSFTKLQPAYQALAMALQAKIQREENQQKTKRLQELTARIKFGDLHKVASDHASSTATHNAELDAQIAAAEKQLDLQGKLTEQVTEAH